MEVDRGTYVNSLRSSNTGGDFSTHASSVSVGNVNQIARTYRKYGKRTTFPLKKLVALNQEWYKARWLSYRQTGIDAPENVNVFSGTYSAPALSLPLSHVYNDVAGLGTTEQMLPMYCFNLTAAAMNTVVGGPTSVLYNCPMYRLCKLGAIQTGPSSSYKWVNVPGVNNFRNGYAYPDQKDDASNTSRWFVTDTSEDFTSQGYKHYEHVYSHVKAMIYGCNRPRKVVMCQGRFLNENAAPLRAYFNSFTNVWSQAADTNSTDADEIAAVNLYYEQLLSSMTVHPFAYTDQHGPKEMIKMWSKEVSHLGVDVSINRDSNQMQVIKDMYIKGGSFHTIRQESALKSNAADLVRPYTVGDAAPTNVDFEVNQQNSLYNWDRTKDTYLFIYCTDNLTSSLASVSFPGAVWDVPVTGRVQDGVFLRNEIFDPTFDIRIDNKYRVHYNHVA